MAKSATGKMDRHDDQRPLLSDRRHRRRLFYRRLLRQNEQRRSTVFRKKIAVTSCRFTDVRIVKIRRQETPVALSDQVSAGNHLIDDELNLLAEACLTTGRQALSSGGREPILLAS